MTFSARRAGCLAALIVLAGQSQSLQAGRPWWQMLTAGVTFILVGTGLSQGVAPVDPPVPTAAPAPSRHPWSPQFGVLPWYKDGMEPPVPELIAKAQADFPVEDCVGPLPELLPVAPAPKPEAQEKPDRWMKEPAELSQELARKTDFENYRNSTNQLVKELKYRTACALRIHQETRRSDKDAILLDDIKYAKVLLDYVNAAFKHARQLEVALSAKEGEMRRSGLKEPAREGIMPLSARLALAEKARAKLDMARKRFVRSILYLEVGLLPEGSDIRIRREHHARGAVHDDFWRAPKVLSRPTPEEPYPQLWLLLPEDADADSDNALDASFSSDAPGTPAEDIPADPPQVHPDHGPRRIRKGLLRGCEPGAYLQHAKPTA